MTRFTPCRFQRLTTSRSCSCSRPSSALYWLIPVNSSNDSDVTTCWPPNTSTLKISANTSFKAMRFFSPESLQLIISSFLHLPRKKKRSIATDYPPYVAKSGQNTKLICFFTYFSFIRMLPPNTDIILFSSVVILHKLHI